MGIRGSYLPRSGRAWGHGVVGIMARCWRVCTRFEPAGRRWPRLLARCARGYSNPALFPNPMVSRVARVIARRDGTHLGVPGALRSGNLESSARDRRSRRQGEFGEVSSMTAARGSGPRCSADVYWLSINRASSSAGGAARPARAVSRVGSAGRAAVEACRPRPRGSEAQLADGPARRKRRPPP